jgi:hypothetical protein
MKENHTILSGLRIIGLLVFAVGVPIVDAAGSTGPADFVTAKATKRAPEIDVQRGGRSLRDGKGSLLYGSVSKPTEITFTIRNVGSAPLRNLKVQVKGKHPSDFKVTQQPKARISPKAKTRFKVRFAPRRSGERRAQLRVVSNDANENPFRINVSGSKKVTPPPPVSNWTGDWDTYAGYNSTGKMLLFQDGTTVTGFYSKANGRITATVQGNTLVGTWSEYPYEEEPHMAGDFVFTMSADGKSFTGNVKFGYGDSFMEDWLTDWRGTRVPSSVGTWSGTWDTQAGVLILTQTGTSITGDYSDGSGNSGKITGRVLGSTVMGTWSEPPTFLPPHDAGDVEFYLSEDGKTFGGNWRYGPADHGWDGGWPGTKLE